MNEQLQSAAGEKALPVSLSGFDLLINSSRLNKGTAFSDHERDIFDLHGLLPPHVGTLDEQVDRRIEALDQQPDFFRTNTPFSATFRTPTKRCSIHLSFATWNTCSLWSTPQPWAKVESEF